MILTQMGFGFSRDDIGGFLPEYLEKKILPEDPFQSIDHGWNWQVDGDCCSKAEEQQDLILKIGICGEHGGEPNQLNSVIRLD